MPPEVPVGPTLLPVLVAFLSLTPEPISLDSITVERARHLSGRVVVAGFLNVAGPFAYPEYGITTIGPVEVAALLRSGPEKGK